MECIWHKCIVMQKLNQIKLILITNIIKNTNIKLKFLKKIKQKIYPTLVTY